MSITDELKLSLEKEGGGGGTLKDFSFSGKDPDKLSADRESVCVGGLKWYPKDYLMINVDELNFSQKVRGR